MDRIYLVFQVELATGIHFNLTYGYGTKIIISTKTLLRRHIRRQTVQLQTLLFLKLMYDKNRPKKFQN